MLRSALFSAASAFVSIFMAIVCFSASAKDGNKPTFDYTAIDSTYIDAEPNGLFENHRGEQILKITRKHSGLTGDSRYFFKPSGSNIFYQLNEYLGDGGISLIAYWVNGERREIEIQRGPKWQGKDNYVELVSENGSRIRFESLDQKTQISVLEDSDLKFLRLPTGYKQILGTYETKLTKLPVVLIANRFSHQLANNQILRIGRLNPNEYPIVSAVGTGTIEGITYPPYTKLATANDTHILTFKSNYTLSNGRKDTIWLSRLGFDTTPEPLESVELSPSQISLLSGKAYESFEAIVPKMDCGDLL